MQARGQPPHDSFAEPERPTLGGLLRRRARLIAIPLVLVPALALVFSLLQDKQYTATTSLVFGDAGGSRLSSADPEREAATNVRLLEVGALEDRVDRRLGDSEAAAGTVDVVGQPESNVVTVKATAGTPQAAATLANTFAVEYVQFSRQRIRRGLAERSRRVRRELDSLSPEDSLGTIGETLRTRLRQLEVAQVRVLPSVEQVRRAEAPSQPSSPKPLRNTIIGLLVGLALGLGLAIVRDRADRRVRDPRSFEEVFGRPIVGRIPRSRALAGTPVNEALPAIEATAFSNLRTNLRYSTDNGDTRSVLVTSAEPGEGKTTVAWNLACAAAAHHSRVLLIEADLRRPVLARRLGLEPYPGLSELLTGQGTLEEVVRPVAVPGSDNGGPGQQTVDVILAGWQPPEPTDLLDSSRMADVLATASSAYDLVVIDTPPASVVSDALPLAAHAEGVLVVGRLARSNLDSLTELSKQLDTADARTLGVVVNSADPPRGTYHYYYGKRR